MANRVQSIKKSAVSLEATLIEKHVMIGWVNPGSLVSILWTMFHYDRRFMGITCAKADLLDPKSMCPKIRPGDGLMRNIESGTMPSRDDVS